LQATSLPALQHFSFFFAESQLRIAGCAVGHDLCKSLWESENYWLCSSHAFRSEERGASEQVRREHDRGCDGARGTTYVSSGKKVHLRNRYQVTLGRIR
jgi:hypothetical protein